MATTSKKVHSRLLARAQVKNTNRRTEQVESPKRDTGPRVTRYEPEAPPWADPNWKPARTGPAVSESLEAYRRAQEWAALRERHGGASVDMFGHRDHAPAGFHPLFGWKL